MADNNFVSLCFVHSIYIGYNPTSRAFASHLYLVTGPTLQKSEKRMHGFHWISVADSATDMEPQRDALEDIFPFN